MDTQCPHCSSSRTRSRVAVHESGTRETHRNTVFFWRSLGVSRSRGGSQSLLAKRAGPGGGGLSDFLIPAAIVLYFLGYSLLSGALLIVSILGFIESVIDSSYEKEWMCLRCGSSFIPTEESSVYELIIEQPVNFDDIKNTKDNRNNKQCSVCGEYKSMAEFDYGNRKANSYCKNCNREVNAAYSRGGKEKAQAYREEKRACWR